MRNELSILIPTYNCSCYTLVKQLQKQCEDQEGLHYEIVVADDGSTDTASIEANHGIGGLDNCRFERRSQNTGRAAIRNFLAQRARYDWLLFVDSDMVVGRADFIESYREAPGEVVYGGYEVRGDDKKLKGNLRFAYEKRAEAAHKAAQRQLHPYADFHTSNFLIARNTMLAHPLDERFRHYGYEDVLFGKHLRKAGVAISHIDNPLLFASFESNAAFVAKTEEGLRTLHEFQADLQGYSRLLDETGKIRVLWPAIRLFHKLTGGRQRRQLTGNAPSLWVFRCYKLGYFLSLE